MLQLVFNSPKRMGKNGYTLYVYKYSIQLLYGIKGGTQCKVEKPHPIIIAGWIVIATLFFFKFNL